MRLFVKKILGFILLPLIFAIPTDIFISNLLKTSKEFPCENEIWNDIYKSKINADIAIFGSSRAWVHFNPMIIEDSLNMSCYNFGEDGSNIMQQYLRFKEYIEFNPIPEIVVLAVDHISLMQNKNGYPTIRYYPYMLWNTQMAKNIKNNKQDVNRIDFYIPLLRYVKTKQIIKNLFLLNKEPYSEALNKTFELNNEGNLRKHGFKGMDLSWNNKQYEKLQWNIAIDSNLLFVLEEFISELKKLDIEIFLVYTPEYIEGQKIFLNRSVLISTYNCISKKYKIKFTDYSDSTISHRKDLYYNVLHLNKIGAQLFTIEFIKEIKARNTTFCIHNGRGSSK